MRLLEPAIGRDLGDHPDATIIDGRDRLVMPGLVNGHLHSSEQFFKGRYEKMPLEVWLLYAYPFLMGPQIPERLLYLRSMLVAIESLRGGVTTICDCFFDPPVFSIERLGVVLRAYADAGIRANVTNSVINIPVLDTLPHAREIMPAELQKLLDGGTMITDAGAGNLSFERSAVRFSGRRTMRVVMAPRGGFVLTVDAGPAE